VHAGDVARKPAVTESLPPRIENGVLRAKPGLVFGHPVKRAQYIRRHLSVERRASEERVAIRDETSVPAQSDPSTTVTIGREINGIKLTRQTASRAPRIRRAPLMRKKRGGYERKNGVKQYRGASKS
jgi:hypothetical protein